MSRLGRCAALVACMLSLALMGCGVDETDVIRGGFAVSVPAKPTGVDVCLIGPDGIEVVPRQAIDLTTEPAPSEFGDADDPLVTLLKLLVAGPTEDEQARGLITDVPAGTRLLIDDISPLVNGRTSGVLGGTELAQPLEVIVSPVPPTQLAVEQIACTLEMYLASSGIFARVALQTVSNEVLPRPGVADAGGSSG